MSYQQAFQAQKAKLIATPGTTALTDASATPTIIAPAASPTVTNAPGQPVTANTTTNLQSQFAQASAQGAAAALQLKAEVSASSVSSAITAAMCKKLGMVDASKLQADISLDVERIDNVFNSIGFHPRSSRIWMVTPVGGLVESKENELALMIGEHFGQLFDRDALEQVAESSPRYSSTPANERKQFVADVLGLTVKIIRDKAKAHRQFTKFELKVDMFAKQGGTSLQDGKLTLAFVHRPFPVGEIDQRIIDDYKEHFPELDDFIELVASARFASSRKNAHVWMHGPTNWGKSFMNSVFAAHGLVVETSASELEKMLAGGPVGRTVDEFLRAWIFAVDEFKGVNREMKQLSTTINYAPKNMPMVSAELYLKLFMSAEHADSLASQESGIEDQFASRFMYLPVEGCLDDRPLFTRSRAQYKRALVAYVAKILNTKVDEYRALGPIGAADKADAALSKVFEKYAIDQKYARLSDAITNIAQQFATDVREAFHRNDFSRATEFQKFAKPYVEDVPAQGLCLKAPKKVLEKWIQSTFNRAEAGKLFYKQDQIIAEIGKVKSVRNGDSYLKGLVLPELKQQATTQSAGPERDNGRADDTLDLEFDL